MCFEQKMRGSGYFKLFLSACLQKRNPPKNQKVLKFPNDRQSFETVLSPLCFPVRTLHVKFII